MPIQLDRALKQDVRDKMEQEPHHQLQRGVLAAGA